ncbi:MAG: bifunctional (p)ppGpp synthetase/guanosine-3',5'-bis(diphosphate) 3'-pyrophosphohydrolase [Ruminococcaceae bacterium]|nr:bifunctional (p)ppGpp synthetase/guanosine-3',5'-bis(diphosphate) 3'-pyrophosphohydrolase [Oscillospiraceae bacterium]
MSEETIRQGDQFFEMLKASGRNYDIEKIRSALDYAATLHEGQFRVSGEPYISHPLSVAEIVVGLGLDTNSVCAALLHDTVEDCADKTSLTEIEARFGKEVAYLVDGLTKLVQLNVEDKEEAHIENIRKMLLAMSKDVRVIFIKLCDRLHNMRTLAVKADPKRRATALETMHVYAPLAHRLGMQKLKQELENLCISYLDPIGYEEIQSYIEEKYGESVDFIENIQGMVSRKLEENHIPFTLKGRIKSVYSIYRKMFNQNKSFDQIYDFYALRIIVDSELECYTALGLIHEMFKSVPGRFKDYISTPKPNLYRSLHTTVIGRDGIPFEVQIRTWDMHHVAEYGIAAHWKYKSGEKSKEEIDKKLEWISRLVETEGETRDPDEFLNALKTDIFHDETFVFTPKGDVIALPQGSTVIDFAYSIHSGVGNSMVGAKINGMIVPIDRAPETGDIVEILTSSASKGPSRDWLSIVKTSEARTKIRSWFKKEKRADNIIAGKAMIDTELKKWVRACTENQRNEMVAAVGKRLGFMSADDVYNTLGYGGISMGKLSGKLRDEYERTLTQPEQETAEPLTAEQIKTVKPKNVRTSGGIVVDGESGCQVKFARCCNPLPGDDVIGFITKGFGISIHKCDCPNVKNGRSNPEYAERWVEAHWESGTAANDQAMYEAQITVYVQDRMGIVADVSVALSEMKVFLLQINTSASGSDNTIINLKISCKNVEHYHSIVSRLKAINGVLDVVRGFS